MHAKELERHRLFCFNYYLILPYSIIYSYNNCRRQTILSQSITSGYSQSPSSILPFDSMIDVIGHCNCLGINKYAVQLWAISRHICCIVIIFIYLLLNRQHGVTCMNCITCMPTKHRHRKIVRDRIPSYNNT